MNIKKGFFPATEPLLHFHIINRHYINGVTIYENVGLYSVKVLEGVVLS